MTPSPSRMPRTPRPQAPSEFEERVVQIDRVARVVKGGRRFRFRATVVIGDRKGRVGLGVGKASEVQGAIQKAIAVAKKEMIKVPSIRNTIPFSLVSEFAGAKLLMKPAREGTGIIAGGAVRPVVELSGITNILSKSLGSDNRINNAKAAIKGFKEIAGTDLRKLIPETKPPAEKTPAQAAAAEKAPKAAKKPVKKPAAKSNAKSEEKTA